MFAPIFHRFIDPSRLGILEKKKDFQRRAKHLHKKKELIDNLKEKAFLRNPEEFAFGMIKATTNSAGMIDKGRRKEENPHAVTKREYKETRPCVREGKVHKFKFERKK